MEPPCISCSSRAFTISPFDVNPNAGAAVYIPIAPDQSQSFAVSTRGDLVELKVSAKDTVAMEAVVRMLATSPDFARTARIVVEK